MTPAQPGSEDLVEAITDDTMHRKQAWKPGEKELMTRSVEALEKIAKNTNKLADHVDNELPETPTTPPPEGQPKEGKPK